MQNILYCHLCQFFFNCNNKLLLGMRGGRNIEWHFFESQIWSLCRKWITWSKITWSKTWLKVKNYLTFIAVQVRLSINWSNLTFDEVITLMDNLDTSLHTFDQLCGFRRSDIRRSNLSPWGFGANFIWIIATEFQSFKKLLEQKEPGNNDL